MSSEGRTRGEVSEKKVPCPTGRQPKRTAVVVEEFLGRVDGVEVRVPWARHAGEDQPETVPSLPRMRARQAIP